MVLRLSGLATLIAFCLLASPSPAGTAEQKRQAFLDAVWRELPESMDVLFVLTRNQRIPPEAEVRKRVLAPTRRFLQDLKETRFLEDVKDLDEMDEADLAELEQRLAAKGVRTKLTNLEGLVQRELERSRQPRRLLRHIRFSGERQRIDQRLLEPGEPPDPSVPYTMILCDAGRRPDGTFVFWEHNPLGKTATLNLTLDKPSAKRDDIGTLGTMGEEVRWMVRIATGSKLAALQGRAEPDPDKVRRLVEGKLLEMSLAVATVPFDGIEADRFEVRLIIPFQHPAAVVYCAVDDCTRVYRVEIYDPRTGRLTQTRENRNFDPDGYPWNFKRVMYYDDGFVETTEGEILALAVNTPIDDEVFEYSIPAGWSEFLREPGRDVLREPGRPPQVLKERSPVEQAIRKFNGRILLIVTNIVMLIAIPVLWYLRHRSSRPTQEASVAGVPSAVSKESAEPTTSRSTNAAG